MKQKWNRFLALALAVIMVIGWMPVSAQAATTTGNTVYLKPHAEWFNDGARFAVYYFDDNNNTGWADMTDKDGDGYYEANVPYKYYNVIFCRMNAGTTENNWDNKWNQTGDLTFKNNNCFTITGPWSNPATGSWSMHGTRAAKLYAEGYTYAYIWNLETNAYMQAWPGVAMTNVEGDLYSVEVPDGYNMVIFNDGSNQTADMMIPTDGSNLYSGNSWSTYCAHTETTTTTTATCTTDGTKTVTCNDCGATVSTEADPATGVHTYENGFCTGCDRPEYIYVTSSSLDGLTVELYDESLMRIATEQATVTNTVTNETFGESYIKVALPSDAAYIVAIWGPSYYTPMTDIASDKNKFEVSFSYPDSVGTWGTYCAHADCDEVTSAANCTDAGSTTYTCKNESCKKTITVTIPANGHNFVDGKCSVCGIPQVIYVDCGDYGPDDSYNFSYSINRGSSINIGNEELVRDSVYMITLENGSTANTIQFSSSMPFANSLQSEEYNIAAQTTGENWGNDLFTVTEVDYSNSALIGEWGKYCPHTDKTTVTTESSCLTKGTETVTCDACGEVVSTTKLDMLGHDWTNGATCTRDGCNVPHYFYVDFGDYYEDCTYEAEVYRCYNPEGTDWDSGFNYEACESEHVTGAVFKFTVPQYAAADNSHGDDAIILKAMSGDLEGYSRTWDANFDSTGKILYSGEKSAWIECPHTYGTTEEVTQAATCITAGSKIIKCVVCGLQVGEPVSIDPTNEHVYGEDGKCTADPKCTATKPYVAQIGDKKYESLEEAIAAASGSDTVKLLDDIVTESLITIDTPVKLDLAGYTISRAGTSDGSVTVYVTSKDVQLMRGNITNTGRGVGIYVADGASAYLYDTNVTGVDYGIFLAGSDNDFITYAFVELSSNKKDGKTTVTSANIGIGAVGCSSVNVVKATVSGGNMGIYLTDNAMLNISDSTDEIKGTIVDQGSETGDGIRAYGNAYVNMYTGTVSGSASGTGIELYQNANATVWSNEGDVAPIVNGKLGICVYGGSFSLKGGTVEGTDTAIVTSGLMADESTINTYIKDADISISGGTITGGNGIIETREASDAYTDTVIIKGGTFSAEPDAAYIASGYDAHDNGDKTWTVVELPTSNVTAGTSTGKVDETLTLTDKEKEEVKTVTDNISAALNKDETNSVLTQTAETLKSDANVVGSLEEVNEALENEGVTIDTTTTVIVEVKPYLDVVVKNYETSTSTEGGMETTVKTVTVDISAYYDVVAVATQTNGEKTEATLEQKQPMTVTETIKITVPLPEGFVSSETDKVYVHHYKDNGDRYVYGDDEGELTLTYEDGVYYATFENPNGFSYFEFSNKSTASVPTAFDLDGATMTLGNSLDMNFVIDTGKLDSSDNGHYAVIVKENADGTTDSVTIPQAQWKTYKNSATQKYVTFSDVAAKEMTDKLYVTIYNSKGIAVTNKWTDSVRDYCMRAIKYEQEQNTLNHKKLALYVDMLNYGAAAQTYFDNYHIDDLATSKLDDTQKAFATSTVTAVNNQVKGKGYLGSTLTLKSNIEMNFVFTKAALVDAQKAVITFTNHRDVAKTVTVTRDQFGEYTEAPEAAWYIPVTDMVLSDCCQVDGKSFLMTCTIYDAEGNVITSAQDSVASYLVRGIEDTSGTKDLYSMIQKLATSAYNYFH